MSGAADPGAVVAVARSWIGTPYHDQASLRGAGSDCLGLVRGVWREVVGAEPLAVPPYSRDWGEVGGREVLLEAARRVLLEIEPAAAGPGAVLLFRMRLSAPAKHAGILTAPGAFVHAYDRTGVIEERLTRAWRRRVAFAFLYPARG
ncbi:peptidase [Rhodosalinus sp. K401]|uniref:peptidase n=1 Tax=Rhodosalinus sp. K401 TaxID=3239195 RepID=UPI003523FD80